MAAHGCVIANTVVLEEGQGEKQALASSSEKEL